MEKDFFAKIAGEYKAVRDGLAPCAPLAYERTPFAPSAEKAGRTPQPTYEQQVQGYHAQLAELRKQFDPYLKDRSPELTLKRRQTPLKSFDFRFETEADQADFAAAMAGKGEWESVTIPHYRGPVGIWTAFYRTVFNYQKTADKRHWLCFEGADYIANVYLNSRFVGSHEGMFAPFSFDVTDIVKSGENILLIEIKNDYPTVGIDGSRIDGNKIYAATGIGWDDPQVGWHHCPPGAGIYHHVCLEERPTYFIESAFIRPDIDHAKAEIWTQVYNSTKNNYSENDTVGLAIGIEIVPFNFNGVAYPAERFENLARTGPGINYYPQETALPGFALWQQQSPCLYKAILSLYDKDGILLDQLAETFGMRKFHMDTEAEGDKGSLFLNNRPILLRGANDMGHMQLAVCREDWEQLIGDILIAKVANMNYYRFTQRPVQKEIYHYCDMLGMLNQTDLPLFGRIRRNQFAEGIRQAGEMERLVRNHPSCFMVTYMNEAFNVEREGKTHRHLGRPELEMFFDCCDRAVRLENPDRVIKRVEGDYDPPTTEGLSDFHCYNMWYTNHALPIGRLYKNHLPPIRIGWKTGCGEFGTEGLDRYEIMSTRYPKEWLPDADGNWLPDRIVNAQSNSMHGDWYEEQEGIHNWIAESLRHQALATKLMTDALRRRSDKVISTAIHLLIDAWPAGWMKVLVGVDRIPKPSFFEFSNSQKPLKLNLRGDRWTAYARETIEVEAWLLNDTPDAYQGLEIVATLRDENTDYASWSLLGGVDAASPNMTGVIHALLPAVSGKKKLWIEAELRRDGTVLDSDRFPMTVYEKQAPAQTVTCIGKRAARVALELGLKVQTADRLPTNGLVIVSDNRVDLSGAEAIAKAGGRVIVLTPDQGQGDWKIGQTTVRYEYIYGGTPRAFEDEEGVAFVARDAESPYTAEFGPQDFAYLYNADKDFIDAAAINVLTAESGSITPILYSYAKPSFFEKVSGHKRRMPVVGRLDNSDIFFISMNTDGRVGQNPVVDKLIMNLLNK